MIPKCTEYEIYVKIIEKLNTKIFRWEKYSLCSVYILQGLLPKFIIFNNLQFGFVIFYNTFK